MIFELASFDLLTANDSQLVSSAGLWSALTRIGRSHPTARILLVADVLKKETIVEAFERVATKEELLPEGVLNYRMNYEEFLAQAVQDTRYIRSYLALDTKLDEDQALGLLGAYGMRAYPLDHELPRPFVTAKEVWSHVEGDDGRSYALLRTKADQHSALIHPRLLHNLLAQDFPVWVALHGYTFPASDVMRLLRQKSAMARYSDGKNMESAQDAEHAQSGVQIISDALSNGESLHTFRLYVLVGGKDASELNGRVEIVNGAFPMRLERVYAPGEMITRLFSSEVLADEDGTPVTTTGMALLAGSALSFRRRTATRGVLLGVDRNQAPVVLDMFDDRNPSYNAVVLGQTGSGKTFAVLLLMLRHLLSGVRLIIVDPQANVDLEFLGEDVYQKSVVGTESASINILDIVHDEIGGQVEMAISMLRMLGIHRDQPLERALLDEALMDLYRPIWDGEHIAPTLRELLAWMQDKVKSAERGVEHETAEMLALNLKPYVTGSRANLFGRATTVDFALDHAVNVFDVSRLPQQGMGGDLRSALLSIMVANINQSIRRRRRAGDRAPILFFVDEMGILMRDPVVASYISAEYKTARARLVGMIVADQDLHSLLGPKDEQGIHHGVPMLANSATTLVFNQRDSEKARIREHFPNLPESIVDMLPALPRGVCVSQFADGDLLVVSVQPSELDRVVLSSRLQDRMAARKLIAQIKKERMRR